jgi:hypothetical protein
MELKRDLATNCPQPPVATRWHVHVSVNIGVLDQTIMLKDTIIIGDGYLRLGWENSRAIPPLCMKSCVYTCMCTYIDQPHNRVHSSTRGKDVHVHVHVVQTLQMGCLANLRICIQASQ